MARFFLRKTDQSTWIFAPAVANTAAPTAAELNAGVLLTPHIAEISGFNFKNEKIDTPDLSDNFVGSIPGEDVVDDSSLNFYLDDISPSLWVALAQGTAGFMIMNWFARTAASKTRVWPVVSAGRNDVITLDADAMKFAVDFTIPSRPELDAVWPAGVTL